MHPKVQSICKALNEFSDHAEAEANRFGADQILSDHKGWHHPALTRNEIANIPRKLATELELANITDINQLNEDQIDAAPSRIKSLQKHNTMQYALNGNAHQSLAALVVTLDWIRDIFEPLLDFGSPEDPRLPAKIRQKISKISNRVDNLDIDSKDLKKAISEIESAHKTAEELPTDIAELNKARKAVEKALSRIEILAEEAEKKSDLINEQSKVASKLLKDSEDNYSISVTKGLSSSFHSRAVRLTFSMWIWVVGLLIALYFGLQTGAERLQLLSSLIAGSNPDLSLILVQSALSIVNLGAPIWFAWLSTKQISQNFKLAEDYNFKASVAKAYEGYRKEAARIDPVMEAKLLHSALNRLDEAPLRYVDEDYHSSPFQELIASPEFKKVIETVPEFKNRFLDIINKALPEKLKL